MEAWVYIQIDPFIILEQENLPIDEFPLLKNGLWGTKVLKCSIGCTTIKQYRIFFFMEALKASKRTMCVRFLKK